MRRAGKPSVASEMGNIVQKPQNAMHPMTRVLAGGGLISWQAMLTNGDLCPQGSSIYRQHTMWPVGTVVLCSHIKR